VADELQEEIEETDERTGTRRFLDWVWDVVRTWGPALFIVLFIRSVIAEPFRIPSGSMVPTLEIGDHILVTKYSYGWRLPLTRIHLGEPDVPDRGDVVVFVKPGTDGERYYYWNGKEVDPYFYPDGRQIEQFKFDPQTGEQLPPTITGAYMGTKGLSYWMDLPVPPFATLDYVKRVVALPGEWVEVKKQEVDGSYQLIVYINDEPQLQKVDPAVSKDLMYYADCDASAVSVDLLYETLGETTHSIYRTNSLQGSSSRDPGVLDRVQVPEGQVFVMGDNRDHSFDSRGWGFVPLRNIKGKARKIWLSYDKCQGSWPLIGSFRGERWWETVE